MMTKQELIKHCESELSLIKKEVSIIRRTRPKSGVKRKRADDLQHEKAIQSSFISEVITELKQLESEVK